MLQCAVLFCRPLTNQLFDCIVLFQAQPKGSIYAVLKVRPLCFICLMSARAGDVCQTVLSNSAVGHYGPNGLRLLPTHCRTVARHSLRVGGPHSCRSMGNLTFVYLKKKMCLKISVENKQFQYYFIYMYIYFSLSCYLPELTILQGWGPNFKWVKLACTDKQTYSFWGLDRSGHSYTVDLRGPVIEPTSPYSGRARDIRQFMASEFAPYI